MYSLALCVVFGFGLLAIGMTNPPESPPTIPSDPSIASTEESGPESEGLRECVITLNTGRKITGFLMHSGDEEIVLRLEGIDTTYQRTSIANIQFLPPVSTRYQEIRDTIEDTDIETRLVLVQWLRTRHAYTLALNELTSILEIEPYNEQAQTLHAWLKAHIELNAKPKTTTRKPKTTKINRSTAAASIPTLTKDQINLMRIYELDLRNPPKMIVPDETLRTLMVRHPDSFPINSQEREAYFKLPEHEKLKLLFTHRARDLYPQVKILEDPAPMRTFKTKVHARNGWIVNACASTWCHGGTEAGDFQLINTRPNTDATAYTNFLIITNYRLDDGTPLIDFDNPARSILLQLATRTTNSLHPHPPVPVDRPGPRFRPVFRSSRDRKYQQTVDWINSIYKPRVKYDLGYPPPPPEPTISDTADRPQSLPTP